MFHFHRRQIVAPLLFETMLLGVAVQAVAQDVPDDEPPASPSVLARPKGSATLSAAVSQRRVKQSQQRLRAGELADAEGLLRGADLIWPANSDPRDRAFVRCLVSYQKGELRTAYDQAGSIHEVGKVGNVNLDAAMLKSLVYLQAGVYPLAEKWAKWILGVRPQHVGARIRRREENLVLPAFEWPATKLPVEGAPCWGSCGILPRRFYALVPIPKGCFFLGLSSGFGVDPRAVRRRGRAVDPPEPVGFSPT